jgi:hypothetical protein
MKRIATISLASFLVAGLFSSVTFAAAATIEAAAQGLSSKKDKGTVSILVNPALADGRLMFKVVAYNQSKEAVTFGDANVKVATLNGRPVALVTLDRLIAEAGGDRSSVGSVRHDPANYSGPSISQDMTGRPDVSGMTGSSGSINGNISPHTDSSASRSAASDAAAQAYIDGLKAAILQPQTIEPSKVAGGQVVTEKLKFSPNDERALHVVVDFNGEAHEFDFAVPAAGHR